MEFIIKHNNRRNLNSGKSNKKGEIFNEVFL